MKRPLYVLLGLVLSVLAAIHPAVQAQSAQPTLDRRAAIDQISRDLGTPDLRIDPATETPLYLHGALGATPRSASGDAAEVVWSFFDRYGAAWGIEQPRQSLRIARQERDQLGYTVLRLEQHIAGIPIFDSDMRAQVDPDGTLSTLNGRLLPDVQLPALRLRIGQAAVVEQALARFGGESQRDPRLGLARIGDVDHLAWEVWLLDREQPARWHLLIDAIDGTVLQQIDVLSHARQRETYDARNTRDRGMLVRSESDPPSADQIVNAAHDNAGRVYDFYRSNFGRDSIDGAGMPIISTVHYGDRYNNAFWDGSQMTYGDGDGQVFGPLPRALDVVGHELTHGITEYTADLAYNDQPGALNEAFSDIFGALIDDDWEIAEDVYTPNTPDDALRSLADPTRYGQPAVWGEYLRMNKDAGGIHRNSGIFAHVAYETALAIGRPQTAQIFYRTLTHKLTRTSDFIAARDLAILSCQELIGTAGINASDCADLRVAFARSGIGGSSQRSSLDRVTSRVFIPLVPQGANLPPARITPLPPPACGAELVRNGGFEAGQTGWPTDAELLPVANGQPSASGDASARLVASDTLLQWLRLPIGARTVTLRLSVQRASSGDVAGPTLNVRAENVDGATITTLANVQSDQPGFSWRQVSTTLDVRHLGDFRLVFKGLYGTHYIDDVSMIAQCD